MTLSVVILTSLCKEVVQFETLQTRTPRNVGLWCLKQYLMNAWHEGWQFKLCD